MNRRSDESLNVMRSDAADQAQRPAMTTVVMVRPLTSAALVRAAMERVLQWVASAGVVSRVRVTDPLPRSVSVMRAWAAGPRLVKQAVEAAFDELRATPQAPPFAWPDADLARRHDGITWSSPSEQRRMIRDRRASAWSSWLDAADREATAPRGVLAVRRELVQGIEWGVDRWHMADLHEPFIVEGNTQTSY